MVDDWRKNDRDTDGLEARRELEGEMRRIIVRKRT